MPLQLRLSYKDHRDPFGRDLLAGPRLNLGPCDQHKDYGRNMYDFFLSGNFAEKIEKMFMKWKKEWSKAGASKCITKMTIWPIPEWRIFQSNFQMNFIQFILFEFIKKYYKFSDFIQFICSFWLKIAKIWVQIYDSVKFLKNLSFHHNISYIFFVPYLLNLLKTND